MKLPIAMVMVLAVTAVSAAKAAPLASCYVNSQGQLEVNVGSQFGFTDGDVRAAIEVAEARRCQVYFSPGNYSYSSPLTINGLKFVGTCVDGAAGPSSLVASNPGGSAIWLRGTSPQLVCLKITSPNATARASDTNANGVTIDNAQDFVVDHVLVDRVAGAGIFNGGGDNGRITSNIVRNSLADGIHNTGSASFVTIASNQVQNAGDDFIAVVSYMVLGSQVHDVSITDNRVSSQPWGRGVTVAGGYNVAILRNSIESCFGACIYIASEPGTYDVDNVQASSNFVRAPDRGNIHQANVLVWCGASGRHVAGVSGDNNNLDRAQPLVRKVAQSGCTFDSVTVSGFYGN